MPRKNQTPTAPPSFFSSEYHDLIGLIYDSVDSPEGFFPFLQRFVEVFQGHSASFSIYDIKASAVAGFWVVNIPRSALESYVEEVGHRDALIETAMAAAESGELRFVASNLDFTDAIPDIEEKMRAGYTWLESYGANEACGAIAFKDDNYLNFFGIQRAKNQPEFTRQELAIFNQFLPHLNRAVGLYTKMSALREGYSPEALALQQIQRGILVFDATFKAVFKNAMAEEIIAQQGGMALSQEGVLLFSERAFSNRFAVGLADAVRASLQCTDTADTILSYRQGEHSLTMVISPLAASGEEESGRGGAMISLYDWSRRPTISTETIRQFFELSEAEARVSALLVEGRSPAEIAEHLSRTQHTIRSHLKSIFQKTNTNRQGELVALLSAIAGDA